MLSHFLRAAPPTLPITFIASASATANTTTLTINKPTGTLDGDLMVVMLSGDTRDVEARTWTLPTGWTEIYDLGLKTSLCLGYKVASSEGSSYTFTISANSNVSGHIVTYRNALPYSIGAVSVVNNGDPACGSVNIPVQQCVLLAALSTRNQQNITWTAPSGFSQLVADSDGTTPSNAIFSYTNPAVGATGTQTFTSSAADATGIMLVLCPKQATLSSVTLVQYATAEGTASSVTVNKPTGTIEGDIMVAWMINRSSAARTWTQLTGWTKVVEQTSPADVAVQYKVAGASEGSTYTFVSDGGNNCIVGIATFRYGSYETVGTIGTATSSGNCTAPSIKTAITNGVILALFAQNASGSFPTPSGYTELYDVNNTGTDTQLACFYKTSSLGDTGTVASDPAGSTGAVAGVLVSIKLS